MDDHIPLSLSYDDVLLVPQRTGVRSCKQVDVDAPLSRHIRLQIPIVSANMDTVTGATMAIAVARAGGIGIIPACAAPDGNPAQAPHRGSPTAAPGRGRLTTNAGPFADI